MARGYGRSLDLTTLLVIVRHMFTSQDEVAFTVRFTDNGWTSWWGDREFDPDEGKWFESIDSAVLALIIGNEAVPGADD